MKISTRNAGSRIVPWAQGTGAVYVSGEVGGNITVNIRAGRFERLAGSLQNHAKLYDLFKLSRFTGRDKPIAKIEKAIAEQRRGYILIRGPAGIGKSTLAAQLVRSNQCPFHFPRISGANPERARKNIAAQLIVAWELFDLAPNDEFPPEADEPDWLVRVLDAAAAKRDLEHAKASPGADRVPPIVVVVDGLDEADTATPGRDTRIPFGLPRPDELPDGVFIIATCKFGAPLEWAGGSPGRHVILRQQSNENMRDVRRYLEQLVSGQTADNDIVRLLEDAHLPTAAFIDTMERKSEGSWVYIRYVLDELGDTQNAWDVTRLESLPEGLDTYYRQQLRAWSQTSDWESLRLPSLAFLAALPRLVSAVELAGYIGTQDVHSVARWVEEELRPFLDDVDDGHMTRYQISHHSLRDLIARDSDAIPLPPGTDYLRKQIREAYRAAHRTIARTLLPEQLDDFSAWQVLPPVACESLPRHAALGGILGDLLRHAAFHLSCPPSEILRVKRHLRNTAERAAVEALEMAQAQWAGLDSVRDRAWWLHIWASRLLADELAASSWRLSERRESVFRAIWSGTAHRTLQETPRGPVWSVAAVELDGGRTVLATGGNRGGENIVRLWDPSTGARIGEPMTGHTGPIWALAQIRLGDGRQPLVTGSGDGTITLWDLRTGMTIGGPLTGHEGTVSSLIDVRRPDGSSLLISAGDDGTVRRWDASGETMIGRHEGPVTALSEIRLGDGCSLVASGGEDGAVRFWDPVAGSKASLEPLAVPGPVRALACINAPNAAPVLAVAGDDREIRLWRIGSAAMPIGSLLGHTEKVLALGLIPRPNQSALIVSGSADQTIRLWDPEALTSVGAPLTGHEGPVWAITVAVLPDRWTLLATASGDKTLRLWDQVGSMGGENRLLGHSGPVTAVTALSFPGSRDLLATASGDGTIRMWDTYPADIPAAPMLGHDGPVESITAITMTDGRIVLASGGEDGTIRIWDADTRQPIGLPLIEHTAPVVTLSSSNAPDGQVFLAFGSTNGTARIWDLGPPGAPSADLTGYVGGVLAVSFIEPQAGKTLLATGGHDNAVRLWNPVTGRQKGEPLIGHTGWVRSIHAVTMPDGRTLLATGGEDTVIRLWDLWTGAEAGPPLAGHKGPIHSVLTISVPDHEGLIASGSSDGSVRLWDLSTGSELGEPLIGHTGTVHSLAMITRSDGRPLLATAGADRSILLWELHDRLRLGKTAGESPGNGPGSQGTDDRHVPS
jgi:WD40 repeat protein